MHVGQERKVVIADIAHGSRLFRFFPENAFKIGLEAYAGHIGEMVAVLGEQMARIAETVPADPVEGLSGMENQGFEEHVAPAQAHLLPGLFNGKSCLVQPDCTKQQYEKTFLHQLRDVHGNCAGRMQGDTFIDGNIGG